MGIGGLLEFFLIRGGPLLQRLYDISPALLYLPPAPVLLRLPGSLTNAKRPSPS